MRGKKDLGFEDAKSLFTRFLSATSLQVLVTNTHLGLSIYTPLHFCISAMADITPPRRTRSTNVNKHPGAIVAPKPRVPSGTAKARREAEAQKKKERADAEAEGINRIAAFEDADMMRQDMEAATPRPPFTSPNIPKAEGPSSPLSYVSLAGIGAQPHDYPSDRWSSDERDHDKKPYEPETDSPTEPDSEIDDAFSRPTPLTPPPLPKPSKVLAARAKAVANAEAKAKAVRAANVQRALEDEGEDEVQVVTPVKAKAKGKKNAPVEKKKQSAKGKKRYDEVIDISDSEPERQAQTKRDEIRKAKEQISAAHKKEAKAKELAEKEGGKSKSKSKNKPQWPLPWTENFGEEEDEDVQRNKKVANSDIPLDYHRATAPKSVIDSETGKSAGSKRSLQNDPSDGLTKNVV